MIVLSKTNLCDESEISLAINAIREHSAPTRVTVRPRSPKLEEYTVKGRGFHSPAELIELLRGMLWGYYGMIIRAKGVVKCGGEMLRFDLTDGMYSITGESASDEQRCVFIGIDCQYKCNTIKRKIFLRTSKGVR